MTKETKEKNTLLYKLFVKKRDLVLLFLILLILSTLIIIVHIPKTEPIPDFVQVDANMIKTRLFDFCICTIDLFVSEGFDFITYIEQNGFPKGYYDPSLETLWFQFFIRTTKDGRIVPHPNITIISLSLTITNDSYLFTYNNLFYTHLTFEINARIPYFEINNLVFWYFFYEFETELKEENE